MVKGAALISSLWYLASAEDDTNYLLQLNSIAKVQGATDGAMDCSTGRCKPIETIVVVTPPPTTTTTTEQLTCASLECAEGFLMTDPDKTCDGNLCTTTSCCVAEATCEGFRCPRGWLMDDASQRCANEVCDKEQCCHEADTCVAHKCPDDMFLTGTPEGKCGKRECGNADCCEKSASCNAFTCPSNTVKMADAANFCNAAVCSEDQCCQSTCGAHSCPAGFTATPEAVCDAAECKNGECCAQNPTCAETIGKTLGFREQQCPAGTHLTPTKHCKSIFNGREMVAECSVGECCKQNESCGECKADHHKLDDAPKFCAKSECGADECCGQNPTCKLHPCPTGFHRTSTATCDGKECSSSECCGENDSCGTFDCPDTHKSISTDTCGGATCTKQECCEKTTTTTTALAFYCDDFNACMEDFEKNLRRDVCDNAAACTHDQCCDKVVSSTTTTTYTAPPVPPPPAPAPCGAFTCPAGQRNKCGAGGKRLLSRNKRVSGTCDSRWGSFRSINDGSQGHWHACDNVRHNTWLTMDLGAAYHVSGMMLQQGSHFNYGYRQLTIMYSADGRNFRTVRTDSNGQCGAGVRKNHGGWPWKTRFVKVKLNNMCGGNHFAIRNWEIYGEQFNGCDAARCCEVIPPPPPPSCMGHTCPAGFMISNTGICKDGKCSNEQCCEESKFGPRMNCRAHGDPHVQTFDGLAAETQGRDVFKSGEYYLVNAPNVQIQARLTFTQWSQSSISEIMMKGVALGGKLLHITAAGMVQFGNQQVGPGFEDEHIVRTGQLIAFKKDLSMSLSFAPASIYLNVAIFMNSRPGVNGFCGNMNGNQRDDGQFVNNDASRVRNSLWGHPMVVEVKPPEKKCEGLLKQTATVFCDARIADQRGDKYATCVFDFCIGGEKLAGIGLDFLEKAIKEIKDDIAGDQLEGKDR